MRKLKQGLWLAIFALIFPVFSDAHLPPEVLRTTNSLAPMLKTTTPAVVSIAVQKVIPLGVRSSINPQAPTKAPQFIAGVGSGVIFDAQKGYIVTNAHVVSNARIILVALKDGRRFRGKLIGKDDGFDIAIIQIPASHLTAMSFSDSDQLKVGDFVAAIGSPFGLSQTVTSGVISALNRSEPKIEGFQSFIQTDASINPGSSGGALVNMQGQLVAINTAILGPDANIGIGFAIPSNMVHSVISQLLKYGKVQPGMLGVIAENVSADLGSALHLTPDKGTLVTQIMPGTPAEQAGIKPEDVILKVDGKSIRSATQLRNTLGLMRPGTKIHLSLLRDNKPVEIATTVGDPTAAQKVRIIPFVSGMRLRDFTELQGDGTLVKGILVTQVSDTSQGALAGLQPGDVILAANQQQVIGVQELLHVISEKPKELLLKVNRNNNDLFLVINV